MLPQREGAVITRPDAALFNIVHEFPGLRQRDINQNLYTEIYHPRPLARCRPDYI